MHRLVKFRFVKGRLTVSIIDRMMGSQLINRTVFIGLYNAKGFN